MDNGIETRHNLLIIQTDQQSCWTLGVYGGTAVETPHIDAIGREGAVFRQFFTNSAVCTPSRGCFITGRYPHSHGAYTNDLPLGQQEVTLAELLSNQGYDTGYAGKWHLAGEAKPGWMEREDSRGFADCRYMYNRGHWKSIIESGEGRPQVDEDRIGDERTYTTDWLTAKTVDFIRTPRQKPFFFMLSIPDPHTPFTVREPYASMFDPQEMDVPATFHESERPNGIDLSEFDIRGVWDDQQLKEAKAQYCGEVKCIDDNVGRLMEALVECSLQENTIVVFTSDHGEYMGEHGLLYKNNLYETAYRIPMIIRWPALIRPGTEIHRLISTVDFQPTMAGLLGIPPSGREQGADASAFLRGTAVEWRDVVFLHHPGQGKIGLFTPRFELVYVRDGDGILFDRVTDPLQCVNLFGHQEYQMQMKLMTDVLAQHCVENACPEWGWLQKKLNLREG